MKVEDPLARARLIREAYKQCPLRTTDLAERFACSKTTVEDILSGYRHIKAILPGEPKNLIKDRIRWSRGEAHIYDWGARW